MTTAIEQQNERLVDSQIHLYDQLKRAEAAYLNIKKLCQRADDALERQNVVLARSVIRQAIATTLS